MELNTAQLSEHFKLAAKLETMLFNQIWLKDTMEGILQEKEPRKLLDEPKAPIKTSECMGIVSEPDKGAIWREAIEENKIGESSYPLMIGILVIFGGGFLIWGLLSNILKGFLFFFAFVFLVPAVILILKLLETVNGKLKDEQRKIEIRKNALRKYEESFRTYKDITLPRYRKLLKTAEDRWVTKEAECAKLLCKLKEKTECLLNDLYVSDFVFEKYHNMFAITSMYEYFLTGRCTELSGPSGAYNLYESEKRQNTIISEIADDSTLNWDRLKDNQYVLYNALKEGKSQRDDLAKEIGKWNFIAEETENSMQALENYCKALHTELECIETAINKLRTL